MDVYTILCNRPFILLQLSYYEFSLDKDYKKTLQEYLDNTQIEIVSDILEYLFRNDRDKANAIYSLRNYYKYFMYRLDDKVLTVDELMSFGLVAYDAEMIKSANQLYIRKYGLEFENQIGELLAPDL